MTGSKHDAARAYALRGWPVFPLVAKGKQPLVEHGLNEATTDKEQIDAWWGRSPNANVALRTGVVFDVLDLDGPEAAEKFRIWCDEHSVDPATIRKAVSRTAKGWHYLFKASGLGNRAKLLGAPIDWRGKGGYIVAPPSIHPSGAEYRWVVHLNGQLPEVPPAWREVLAPTVPTKVPLRDTVPRATIVEGEHAAYLVTAFTSELDKLRAATVGERNVRLFEALCNIIELVNAGLDAGAIDHICETGRALGLDDREVERTRASALAKVGGNAREIPPPRVTTAPVQAPIPAPVQVPAVTRLQPSDAIYQGLIGEAVQELVPWTEADPVGVLATLLAGAGCAIGRGPHARVATTRHPLLVWPLLLGRTSTGRKGTAHDVAESLLRVADPVFVAGNITGGLSSGEGLIYAVRDAVLDVGADPSKEPKVLDPGVDDKRRWVVETEFGGTMARAKREGSSLSACLRQAWDGKTLTVLTKSAVVASGAHIAISAHVTPREFLSRLRDSDLVGGTYNRFLPLLVTRSKLLPDAPTPPAELLETYGWELKKRLAEARTASWLPRTDAAGKAWHDLYHELTHVEEGDLDNDRLGQFVARSVPYALRLSALYALLDGARVIDERHVEAAAALVRYSIASVRELLRSPETPHLERLINALTTAGEQGLTRTEVSGLFNRQLTAPQLDELLRSVPGLEAHEERRTNGPGRPTLRYLVPAKETKDNERVGSAPPTNVRTERNK